jgi:hypothetical protein
MLAICGSELGGHQRSAVEGDGLFRSVKRLSW